MDSTISFLLLLWVTTQFHLSPSHQLAVKDILVDDDGDDVTDHVARLARSDGAEGYDIAFFHGPSLTSGEHKRLTKRDVEDHASHPSTESRNFELRLTSGERLRMSVQKRSAMSPDVTVVERAFGKEELRRPQVRDCFFSGGLEGEEGHVSLSLCDGQVIGGIHMKNRDVQLRALPELRATRRRRETKPMRVLVTSSTESRHQKFEDDVLKRESPDENRLKNKSEELNAGELENMTVEVGVYLDRTFIKKVEDKLGLNTTQQLTDLVTLKWNGISALMSNPLLVGRNISFKVVHLEIWREIPTWYNDSGDTSMGARMNMICRNTVHMPFDYILLETASTSDKRLGLSWLNTMCNPRWRCSVAKGTNFNHWIEAHEMGHSMGLPHEKSMAECDKNGEKGFMTTREAVFRECYAKILNRTLRQKTCLFKQNVDISKYSPLDQIAPLHRGQLLGFDGQCRLVKGEGFEYLHIPSTEEQICKSLTCIRKSPLPELATMGAFLGTPCGKEKMCYANGCVPWVDSLNPKYLRPLVKVSHWGPWSEFSPCENTCGVAVSVSTRKCNTSGPYLAPFCQGDSTKAQLCSSLPACSDESSVESELVRQRAKTICSKVKASSSFLYNLTGEGQVKSTTGEVDKCVVTCDSVSSQSPNSFLLQDGTPCSGTDTDKSLDSMRDISWRCVQGRCMAFGCNGRSLGDGGGVEKDECGVCGGDGLSCEKNKANNLTDSPPVEP